MTPSRKWNPRQFVLLLFMIFASGQAHAYLGPGAGLGMIGSLIAIVVVGLVIVLGLVVYPIRMMRKRKAERRAQDGNAAD